MPITITKKKAVATKKEALVMEGAVSLDLVPIEGLADRYGDLEDRCNALMQNPLFTQFDEVKKELQARVDAQAGPTDTLEIKGEHWRVSIGVAAKAPRKVTDVAMIQKFVGQEVFAKIAKVNISDVDKYLTPDQVALVVEDSGEYTNRRKVEAAFLG